MALFGRPEYMEKSGLFKFTDDEDPIEVGVGAFHDRTILGRGGFGKVYMVTLQVSQHEEKFSLAEKIIQFKDTPKEKDAKEYNEKLESWYRELKFFRESNHEHIVRFYGHIATKGKPPNTTKCPDSLRLYLELMTSSFKEILTVMKKKHRDYLTTPFKLAGEIRLKPLFAFLYNVCCGIGYLHDKGYMHRDLKPSNILIKVENGRAIVKLTDFGTIKEINDLNQRYDGLHSSGKGTTLYIAPEVMTMIEYRPYSSSCDLWSLAITTLELIMGEHPIMTDDRKNSIGSLSSTDEVYHKTVIGNEFASLPSQIGVMGNLGASLSSCLKKKPEERPTVKDFLQAMGIPEKSEDVLFEWYSGLDVDYDIIQGRRY